MTSTDTRTKTRAETRSDVHPRVHGSFVLGEVPGTGINLAAALSATAHANAICEPQSVTR